MSSVGTLPPALQKGTIAFISPSSRVNHLFSKRVQRAAAWFEAQGHKTKEIYTRIDPSTSHAAAIKLRCDEIHQAFADPEVSAIICTIGGSTANELLPHLNYDLIRANPKIFSGYSDITLLHHAIFTQSNLRTFYGAAVVPEFGEYPEPHPFTVTNFVRVVNHDSTGSSAPDSGYLLTANHEFTQEFLDWMSEESNQRARKYQVAPGWKWLRKGKAKGRIFGGCLPSLVQICGSKYFVDLRGKILFVETPEGPRAPDDLFTVEMARMALCDLRNAGVLDDIVGLVVGRPLFYDAATRTELEQMILNQTEGLDIPILANVDIGHTSPALTIPLNALSELDFDNGTFKFLDI